MCIRDRHIAAVINVDLCGAHKAATCGAGGAPSFCTTASEICLLYTSDAADERSSVDLGGRRILKKKTNDA